MSTSVTTPVPAPVTTGTPTGTTRAGFVVVALVSVVLSVAASTSVVALTGVGADQDRPGTPAVAGLDPVEEGASDALTELGDRRAESFCPTKSYPAAAC